MCRFRADLGIEAPRILFSGRSGQGGCGRGCHAPGADHNREGKAETLNIWVSGASGWIGERFEGALTAKSFVSVV